MTYSIVARDPSTGALGVAVQSRWFSVGSVVTWGEPGVGVVATQAFAEPAYGPRALNLLRGGASASDALARLVAEDRLRRLRQVAVVDAEGGVAVHTGQDCISEAGHVVGEGFSCQANMMLRDTVWDAMAKAFGAAEGALADRLMAALDAAEGEGGDFRGRQSAAMLVVSGDRGQPGWSRELELRVEDHAEPLRELRRLLRVQRAYERAGEAEEALLRNDGSVDPTGLDGALADDNVDWIRACALVIAGRRQEGQAVLEMLMARSPGWRVAARRYAAAGLLPQDPELLAALEPKG